MNCCRENAEIQNNIRMKTFFLYDCQCLINDELIKSCRNQRQIIGIEFNNKLLLYWYNGSETIWVFLLITECTVDLKCGGE